MKQLAILGSINADHVISVPHFAKPGETLIGSNYHIAYGGKGANQAVAAARLCDKNTTQVHFIACVGDDSIGQQMKNSFSKDGINVEAVSCVQGENTGIALIQVAENGENSIVISAGANACLNEAKVAEFSNKIVEADYLLMQLETPLSTVITAAKLAKENQTKVVLNPAPAKVLSDELFGLIDIITPNETETEILTGITVMDEESAVKAATVFHDKGIEQVLITLGSKGVYVSQKGQGEMIAGFQVNAVDTTAAGDTFNGAFLTALLEGKNIHQAVLFAQAAAAICVTRAGAQPSIPQREEVMNFLVSQG